MTRRPRRPAVDDEYVGALLALAAVTALTVTLSLIFAPSIARWIP
jgi:hypothetical protein